MSANDGDQFLMQKYEKIKCRIIQYKRSTFQFGLQPRIGNTGIESLPQTQIF